MAKICYEAEFEFGELVYLKTDIDQHQRIVTGHSVRGNTVRYELSCGTQETYHLKIEISREKNVLL